MLETCWFEKDMHGWKRLRIQRYHKSEDIAIMLASLGVEMVRCMVNCADAWNRMSAIESASYPPIKEPLFDIHAPCPERCAGLYTSLLHLSFLFPTAMIINFTASFTGRIGAKHIAKSEHSYLQNIPRLPSGRECFEGGIHTISSSDTAIC